MTDTRQLERGGVVPFRHLADLGGNFLPLPCYRRISLDMRRHGGGNPNVVISIQEGQDISRALTRGGSNGRATT